MIRDDVEALALADACGALDADERQRLQTLLASLPPGDQAAMARVYDVSYFLALSAASATPPARVRESLMAAVGGAPAAATRGTYTLRAAAGEWTDSPYPGIRIRVLAVDRPRNLVTMLLRAEPGARYPSHRHSTCEECYVLSGSVVIEGQVLGPGDFHHADGESSHGAIHTIDGAEVLLVGAITDYLPGGAP